MENRIPSDVKACWLPVVRSIQSKARSRGLSILTVTVLVNQDGNPVCWLEPQKIEIHPKSNAGEVIKLLKEFS